ncbi:MAG: hypothetical protein A3F31_03745 [Candidatus Levybacteria bacterium RIFCSPHIGHO2_12_FULL_38_12]|nr:MAG: hypothetical protein A2770_02140 [Candidatus Levybacteria bacterium RIFCSPHIGHO2_01_FULL_38_12]OGH21878.1 MAG: hypothetical protein A3D75_00360 [Candidatus Levybacteria bacterium RIFCSPHIGHO2_02_FULL_37_18]OGH22810.1 MAG: hypothetical protein A3F31_03745 [Candidatus Levybacteria bacterium RIFCSPHIGHO2_12_FULL_38_12]OGH33535.1 MAG: hypothetical protein A3A47_01705 [Candidatus Levybacteria bacterium RIFCSPLOWO2_01_FULL_37_20]OGH44456.1 MAG: hypothetical protein A3J14_03395 [Candidatus Lev
MQPQELVAEVWDIKRIIIGVIGVVVIGAGGFGVFVYVKDHGFPQKWREGKPPTKNVIGASTQKENNSPSTSQDTKPPFSLPSKNELGEKLDTIKKQVQSLSISEIASSSPHVQKVLQDIKALEEYPHNQVKDMCQKICSSF